jgi:iron uptake system component EfeO
MRNRLVGAVWLAALAIVTVACQGSGGGSTLDVSMRDYELTVSPGTVPAGTVTLEATSEGPSVHEFEVFEVTGDVAITDGLTLVDEVEDIVPGASAELTLDLEPGTYAVICNLSGHYANGMHTTFVVA